MSKKIDIDITVPNQTKYLAVIGKIAESLAHSLGDYSGDKIDLAYQLNLVLTEATTNAIYHANECDPSKEVKISISVADKLLKISVFDQGTGFDINPLAKTKVKDTDEGGRGVPIIFKLMDHVEYKKSETGHVLEMIKLLN
jgi:serine/threonine-protein kinase RsbW